MASKPNKLDMSLDEIIEKEKTATNNSDLIIRLQAKQIEFQQRIIKQLFEFQEEILKEVSKCSIISEVDDEYPDRPKTKTPTKEQLDKELKEYMKYDSHLKCESFRVDCGI